MSTNFQQTPYLRQQRDFPPDNSKTLAVQVDKAYVDTALAVNQRTIGIFALNTQIVTGNSFYITGSSTKQQSLRQIYQFSDSSLTIAHGINFSTLTNFVNIYGTFFDGINWQSLPYVDVTAANNQINIKVNSTNILITKGGGSPPTCANGLIFLEWISQY